MIRTAGVLTALLAAGCSGGGHPSRAVDTGATAKVTPSPTCTTYTRPSYPPGTIGGRVDSSHSVPFTDIDGPFELGGTRWSLIDVSPSHPASFGVVLGHDEGMAVDSVNFLVKPYGYKGGDFELPGAVWHSSRYHLRADGQRLMVTFRGRDDQGRALPRGAYKVEVALLGHRTSMSTCVRDGPVPFADRFVSATGIIYGLASIDGAPRPKAAG